MWWRFHDVPVPSSPLFRRDASPTLPIDPAEWVGRFTMDNSYGRALLLDHHHTRTRLLIPIADPDDAAVQVGVRTTNDQLSVTINGVPAPMAQVGSDTGGTPLTGPWRSGWNIVEVTGAAPLDVTWIMTARTREGG